MLIAALGCDLAWGIIDAGVYLIVPASTCKRRRDVVTLRAVRTAADAQAARRIPADAYLPRWPCGCFRRTIGPDAAPVAIDRWTKPTHPHLTKRDWLAGLGVCLLCFLSTFPVAAPFMIVGDARTALRLEMAVMLLFFQLRVQGISTGLSPWVSSCHRPLGGALVGVAIRVSGADERAVVARWGFCTEGPLPKLKFEPRRRGPLSAP